MQQERERIFYNALAVYLQSNYRALDRLRARYPTWEAAWNETAATEGASPSPDPETLYNALEKNKIALVLQEDSEYPALLREIPWSPFGIYTKSELKKSLHAVAVVGTRKATPSGKEFARTLAADLSRAGCTVTSGLAFGIDAAAHEGTLGAKGNTVAVLGNGLDVVYPRSHESLAKKILDAGGTLLSEYPPGTPSLPQRFLERNRIVSGLSEGVVVVEAPRDSGARVTARFALEQNREVFVVPGPARHPNFEGSHDLIRQGATLVTDARQICEGLGIPVGEAQTATFTPRTSEEKRVWTSLTSMKIPLSIDKLIELTTLNPQTVHQTLTHLLLRGIVREEGEGYTIT